MKWSQSHSVVSDSLWPQGILQARILEWVAFPFSRGSTQSRDQTQVSHTAGGFFTSRATREAQKQKCSVFTPITSVPHTNRFNKYFWLNIPNLLARQSGKIAQAGFKVLLYSFTVILNLLLYGTIYRGLVLFQLITKQNTAWKIKASQHHRSSATTSTHSLSRHRWTQLYPGVWVQ